MSRLEELIQQLCPDGVEYKAIKEEYQRLKGTPITAAKMKEIARSDGEVRVFAGGKTVIDAHEKDIPNANIIYVPAVLVQSRGVIDAIYYEKPFTFKNEMWAYTHPEKTSVKFLYYVLKSNMGKFRDAASGMGSLPQISLSVTEDFRIPLPPLPVQQEIVRILDTFTELTAELNEKLTAELAARKKQYEYYRDELLHKSSFRDVRVCKLGEVANIHTGSKPAEILEDYSEFEYINAGTSNSGYVKTPNSPGDTVTTPSRGQGGIGFVGYQSRPFHLGPLCYSIRSNDENIVTNKFIYYWLSSHAGDILAFKKEGGTPALNRGDLMGLRLCVPHISVQHRIVSILDRFDALCNDLTSGLPAEMEARRKQYEYYRDKLLSFKVKG